MEYDRLFDIKLEELLFGKIFNLYLSTTRL